MSLWYPTNGPVAHPAPPVTIAQNTFLITWLVQTAISLTFLVALGGLALQLRRPGARLLALTWVVATLICVMAVLQRLAQEGEWTLRPGIMIFAATGLLYSTIPITGAAAAAVATGGRLAPPVLRP